MSKIIVPIVAVLTAAILCSCSTTASYNFGTQDEYRLGEALLYAIAQRENAAAMQLVNRGAPLNYQDKKDEWTPLVYAIYYENWSMAEFLIRAGVNVNLRDQANRTALMWCAMRGDLTVLRLLVEHGADINAVDVGGRGALLYALTYDNGAAAKYLAEIGKLPPERRIRTAHIVMAEEPGKEREATTTDEAPLQAHDEGSTDARPETGATEPDTTTVSDAKDEEAAAGNENK